MKIYKQKYWAAYALETIGTRAGTYFLLGVGDTRSAAQRIRDEVKNRHNDWKFKIKQVEIKVL